MRDIFYNGKDAVYREDLPMPVRAEKESLIKIHMCAVCNTDKEVRKGYRPDFRGVMGHEFVGEVVESADSSLIGKHEDKLKLFEPALKLLNEGKIKLPPIELYDLKDFEKAFASRAFKAGFSFT